MSSRDISKASGDRSPMRVSAAAITAAACGVKGDCSSWGMDPKPRPGQREEGSPMSRGQ